MLHLKVEPRKCIWTFDCDEALLGNFRQLIHLLLSYKLGHVLMKAILYNCFKKLYLRKKLDFSLPVSTP